MENNKLSHEEITEILDDFQTGNYQDDVIKIVQEDLEYGLSKEQVMIYKKRSLDGERRAELSKAMRMGMPQDIIVSMVNKKYTALQIDMVAEKYNDGISADIIRQVVEEFKFGHDFKKTFDQVSERMANTKEQAPEEETSEVLEGSGADTVEDNAEDGSETDSHDKDALSKSDFLESVQVMMNTFADTFKMQMDLFQKSGEGKMQAMDENAEKHYNDRITELETNLSQVKKQLSETYTLIETKEKQIRSLSEDMDVKRRDYDNAISEKDTEIKHLREEMEQMKSGSSRQQPIDREGVGGMGYVLASGSAGREKDGIGNADVDADAGIYKGNYVTTFVTKDGRQIPIQVERTERRSHKGLASLVSKFLPLGPAKTILTRMIEGRYSPEQLSELEYAYSKGLAEQEVNELIEANLPADEMRGIINVVAAAKGGEA